MVVERIADINVLGVDSPGAFQTTWTVPLETLHYFPKAIDLKLGAVVEPIAVARHDVRLGGVRDKDYVVVLGAGPIGMLIALLAKNKGATPTRLISIVFLSGLFAFEVRLSFF